jgi:hypothetical protein
MSVPSPHPPTPKEVLKKTTKKQIKYKNRRIKINIQDEYINNYGKNICTSKECLKMASSVLTEG